jgi:hypothetical protein
VTSRARLAAVSIGLIAALSGAPGALAAADPALYVHYTMTCTFSIVGDNGAPISTIPPGRYQIVVSSPQGFAEPDLSGVADPNYACGGSLSFRLTGPGVSLHTTLEDGDAAADQLTATFQVGTYTAFEDRRPTVARLVFSVAGGAASTGGGTSPSSTPSTQPTTKPANTASTSGLRGTLMGSVTTAGKLVLRLNGKAVTSLRAGRYKITVLDETSKSGFLIQKLGKNATTVTSKPFLGRNSILITFNAGKWFYFSPAAKKTGFTVTAA